MELIDKVNVEVNGSGDLLSTLSTYTTKILKPNIVDGKNILTQAMISSKNTKYVIKYDYELEEDITVPEGCVLEFDGGSIDGAYTVTGTNTSINAGLVKIFNTDVTLAGSWNVAEAYPEWFGAKGDGVTDDSSYIAKCAEIGVIALAIKKVYRVASNITLSKSVSILGFGSESILRLYKPIKTDDDNNHLLEIRDCRIEVYMTTGNAIEIIKNTNQSAPSSAINIHDVYFYFRNNVLNTLDSVVIYIKGIQGANIHNCTFKGDGNFGTFIEMSASNTQPTMNTTINGCYFSAVKYCVKLETTSEYTVYLCGIRLVNNSFLGCTYGIFAKNVDNLLIADSMLDYNMSPIIAHHVQSLWIHHNYIQTIVDGKACIECEPGGLMGQMRIDNNSLWQAANGRTVDGIRLKGTSNTDMFLHFFVCYNNIRDLDNFLVLDYCNHGIIDGNICQTTNTFCKGASYMINTFIGNKCDGVTNFFKSFNPSNRISLNVSGNSDYALETTKDITFDGVTRRFEYPVNILGDNIEYYDIKVYSNADIPSYKSWFNYDERKFVIEFSSAPANSGITKITYRISSY